MMSGTGSKALLPRALILPDSTVKDSKGQKNKRKSSNHQDSQVSTAPKTKKSAEKKGKKVVKKKAKPCDLSAADLDLSCEVHPISYYLKDRQEMMKQVFQSLKKSKIVSMLPGNLKGISMEDLEKLCFNQLEIMSKKRITALLNGVKNEAISSSGTEDDSTDDIEEIVPKASTSRNVARGSTNQPPDSTSEDVELTVHQSHSKLDIDGGAISLDGSKTKLDEERLELLELEMRARAIKKMLAAQPELPADDAEPDADTSTSSSMENSSTPRTVDKRHAMSDDVSNEYTDVMESGTLADPSPVGIPGATSNQIGDKTCAPVINEGDTTAGPSSVGTTDSCERLTIRESATELITVRHVSSGGDQDDVDKSCENENVAVNQDIKDREEALGTVQSPANAAYQTEELNGGSEHLTTSDTEQPEGDEHQSAKKCPTSSLCTVEVCGGDPAMDKDADVLDKKDVQPASPDANVTNADRCINEQDDGSHADNSVSETSSHPTSYHSDLDGGDVLDVNVGEHEHLESDESDQETSSPAAAGGIVQTTPIGFKRSRTPEVTAQRYRQSISDRCSFTRRRYEQKKRLSPADKSGESMSSSSAARDDNIITRAGRQSEACDPSKSVTISLSAQRHKSASSSRSSRRELSPHTTRHDTDRQTDRPVRESPHTSNRQRISPGSRHHLERSRSRDSEPHHRSATVSRDRSDRLTSRLAYAPSRQDSKSYTPGLEPSSPLISPSKDLRRHTDRPRTIKTFEGVPSGGRRVTSSIAKRNPARSSDQRSRSPVRFPRPNSPEVDIIEIVHRKKAAVEVVVLSD